MPRKPRNPKNAFYRLDYERGDENKGVTRKVVKPAKPAIKAVYKALNAKVEIARKRNNARRVKPPYVTPYLLNAVATVVNLPAIDKAQVRDHHAPVVVIDARLVVRKVGETLHLRPDNTVRARLITLATLDKRVGKVSYLRYLANNHPNAVKGHPDAYKVILFRTK